MADPCVTATCWNPRCGRLLNHYAHGARVGGRERLFCTASCFNAFKREERWIERMMNVFSVREPLPGLFCEVGNERQTVSKAAKDGFPPPAVAIASAALIAATVAAFW